MNRKIFFRSLLFISLVVATSLACQLVDTIHTGAEVVGTGQAVATEIGAFATEFIPGGIDETAIAVITEVNPGGILETAQVAITEKAPLVGKTMQAVVTEVYTSPEEAPPDIPVMDGEKSAFIGSPESVSYFINTELQDVINFYRQQMPVKGWQEKVSDGFSNADIVKIKYQKENRTATIVLTQIPFVGQTTVVITIDDIGSSE
jgi:hypothetical protein